MHACSSAGRIEGSTQHQASERLVAGHAQQGSVSTVSKACNTDKQAQVSSPSETEPSSAPLAAPVDTSNSAALQRKLSALQTKLSKKADEVASLQRVSEQQAHRYASMGPE